MRSLFTLGFIAWLVVATFMAPFVGTLAMVILNYLSPDRLAYGFMRSANLSLLFGILTVVLAIFIDKKKHFPNHPAFYLIALYLVWITLTSQFAWADEGSVAFKWDRTFKTIGFSLFSMILISSRVRIEAFVWALVLCVGYFACAGGVKTILSGGGGYTVIGASNGFLGPRSHLATAIIMVLPLVWFLKKHTIFLPPARWVNWVGIGFILLGLIAIVGTQSRTGLVAVAAVGLMATLRTKFKFRALAAIFVISGLALTLAPAKWTNRMLTITAYEQDGSAISRIKAWQFAIDVANQSPITGGGFRVFLLNREEGSAKWLDAHSIYFEVLAEHGYVGLSIFLAIMLSSFLSCYKVSRLSSQHENLAWAHDLSQMLFLSFVGFAVGGAFITIASHALLYDFVLIITVLNVVVLKQIRSAPGARR